jgi:hypothetical protein
MIIVRNRAQCTLCKEILESEFEYDRKGCSCGNLSVDGGLIHLSRSCRTVGSFIEFSEWFNEQVRTVDS